VRPKASRAGLICRTDQCFQRQRLLYTCGTSVHVICANRCANRFQTLV